MLSLGAETGMYIGGIADDGVTVKVKEYIVQLGRDGWEFCGTLPERDGYMLIFKRPTHE